MRLGNGEAEHAEIGEPLDHLERDIGIGPVPALRVGNDLGVGETPHFRADRLQRLVEAGIADGAVMRSRDQFDQPRAVLARVAGLDQRFDRALAHHRDDRGIRGRIRRAG